MKKIGTVTLLTSLFLLGACSNNTSVDEGNFKEKDINQEIYDEVSTNSNKSELLEGQPEEEKKMNYQRQLS